MPQYLRFSLSFLWHEQIAVHFGIGQDVGRWHTNGFEANGAAAVREFILIRDVKVFAVKTIYRCCR